MTSVQDGAFYGWPYSYYGDHVDERVRPARPDMVAKAIAPDYALSSHVAALGLIFSNGSAMPDDYANGAFIGQHGSWNRDAFNGYKVSYVPFTDGKPSGMAQDVVTGFIEGDKAYGRPVGVGIDGTGALLVADDAGNTVWRVAAADGSVTESPMGSDRAGTSQADPSPDQATSGQAVSPAENAPDDASEVVEPAEAEETPSSAPVE